MNKTRQSQMTTTCTEGSGILPSCAPLANSFIPCQSTNSSTYEAPMGLIRGTMYPALDLPFMNMVNQTPKTKTQMNRLQALNFAISELALYLDTHKDDTEALELFNQYVNAYGDALQRYEQDYGSTTQFGAGISGRYDWTDGPWPWEYDANKEA